MDINFPDHKASQNLMRIPILSNPLNSAPNKKKL